MPPTSFLERKLALLRARQAELADTGELDRKTRLDHGGVTTHRASIVEKEALPEHSPLYEAMLSKLRRDNASSTSYNRQQQCKHPYLSKGEDSSPLLADENTMHITARLQQKIRAKTVDKSHTPSPELEKEFLAMKLNERLRKQQMKSKLHAIIQGLQSDAGVHGRSFAYDRRQFGDMVALDIADSIQSIRSRSAIDCAPVSIENDHGPGDDEWHVPSFDSWWKQQMESLAEEGSASENTSAVDTAAMDHGTGAVVTFEDWQQMLEEKQMAIIHGNQPVSPTAASASASASIAVSVDNSGDDLLEMSANNVSPKMSDSVARDTYSEEEFVVEKEEKEEEEEETIPVDTSNVSIMSMVESLAEHSNSALSSKEEIDSDIVSVREEEQNQDSEAQSDQLGEFLSSIVEDKSREKESSFSSSAKDDSDIVPEELTASEGIPSVYDDSFESEESLPFA
jgi:hypothetical protein